MNEKKNIIDLFKNSISSTVRAISENKNIDITYSTPSKTKKDNQIILPSPSIKLLENEKNVKIQGNKEIKESIPANGMPARVTELPMSHL